MAFEPLDLSPDWVGIRALVNETGLSGKTVHRRLDAAAAEGRIKAQAGKWPRTEALATLAADVDPARVAGHSANGRGSVELVETSNLSKARALAEHERARKLRIQNEEAAKRLVDIADVLAAGTDLVTEARTILLALGDRVAPRVIGQKSIADISAIITDEVTTALRSLADADRFAAKLLGGDDD